MWSVFIAGAVAYICCICDLTCELTDTREVADRSVNLSVSKVSVPGL